MAKTMKAQVFHEPEKMTFEDVPVPAPADDQVLVRVKACGICGSDVAYYFGASSLETPTGKGPLILGHELAGEVVEVGKLPAEAKLFKPGDRVTVDPVQYCNACEVCKKGQVNLCENKAVLGVSTNGGFAEYAVSHFTGLHRVPSGVPFEAAAMVEPLADAVYAVGKMEIQPGDVAVVFGPGVIGIMMVQLAKAAGAGKVILIGTRDYRLKIGQEYGADAVFNMTEKESAYYTSDIKGEISALTGGKFADAVVTATGSVEAMEMALEISGRRGRIVYFGLPSDKAVVRVRALPAILWDKTIRFSWLAPLTWPRALATLASGQVKIDKLCSHKIALKDLARAIGDVKNRKGDPMKVVVTF
ncbi:MAG: alcohol dehydrogenase catalytic domain-containing protein [Planctomycetes bacterium]|nr:alcohol dehydrogenase catalytic domain-containing protein [Planctomycetota bacterium]